MCLFLLLFPLQLSLFLLSARRISTKVSFRFNYSLLWPTYFVILTAEVPFRGSYWGPSSVPSHPMLDLWLTQWYWDMLLTKCFGLLCQGHWTNLQPYITFAKTPSSNKALPFYFTFLFKALHLGWLTGINNHSALQSMLEYLFLQTRRILKYFSLCADYSPENIYSGGTKAL
jgi:hypothetical protein